MNKKKILLSTAIATTMLISGITIPTAFATTENKNESDIVSSFQTDSSYLTEGNSIAIMLKKNEKYPELTRAELVSLVENKLSKGTVTEIKDKDNKVITDNSQLVGTGATVTLKNQKKFTVVLYGDVNGDGKITIGDAACIAKARFNKYSLNTSAKKNSANLVLTEKSDITTGDAAAAAQIAYNKYTTAKYDKFQADLFPADNMVVVENVIEEVIDNMKDKMPSDVTNVEFKDDNLTVTINSQSTTDLNTAFDNAFDAFWNSGLFDSMLTEAINGYSNLENVTITYGDNKTISYNDLMTGENGEKIKNMLREIKNNKKLDKTTARNLVKLAIGQEKIDKWKNKNITELIGKEIKVSINLKDNDTVLFDDLENAIKEFNIKIK